MLKLPNIYSVKGLLATPSHPFGNIFQSSDKKMVSFCRAMRDLDLQELPPLVYQLLLLSTKVLHYL